MRTIAALTCCFALAGCGALFNGGPAKVTFTSAPEGAEVWIDGTRRGTTPVVLDLSKNQDYTILLRKPGHSDVTMPLTKRVSGGYVVLDVLGGLLPVIIDAATGSWFVLNSNAVHGTMTPVQTGQLTPEELDHIRQGAPAAAFIRLD